MASDAKKARKKKQREVESHMKVLRRREAIRKLAAEKSEKEKQAKLARLLEDGPMKPIKNPETVEKDKALMVKRNARMLKALEEKWLAEQKKRADLNEQLEKEGFKTIEEKLEHLKQMSLSIADGRKKDGGEAVVDVGMLDESAAVTEEKIS